MIKRNGLQLFNRYAVVLMAPLICWFACQPAFAQKSNRDSLDVKAEHGGINMAGNGNIYQHTGNPDAQWFPDAGFGLFLHWGIASVKGINISWSMIPGRKLATAKMDEAELTRIYREKDFNLDGKTPSPTPNEYFEMAKDFNPDQYDADKWIKAARDAGFTYAVLTTRHHEGFALWPSDYNIFNTKLYMGGRDLVAPFVKACRKYGLKVGLYYSPPDWYYERDVKNFMDFQTVAAHPEYPAIDANLNVRPPAKSNPEELASYQKKYLTMVKGQVTELLTRYGKIDLLWFDGKPSVPNGESAITANEIRAMQPGIVINPRLHGTGDYKTFERVIPESRDRTDTVWAEFCNTWAGGWPYMKDEVYRANGFILGQLVKCKAMGINYLLGIGPMASGELHENAYKNMQEIKTWMARNQAAIKGVKRLPANEQSSVPATASGIKRFLYLIPEFSQGVLARNQLPLKDETITYHISKKPKSVNWLTSKQKLSYDFINGEVSIRVPASVRSNLVDVVEVEL